MTKVMLAPYCVVVPLRKFKKEDDEITLGLDGSPGALKHSFAQQLKHSLASRQHV